MRAHRYVAVAATTAALATAAALTAAPAVGEDTNTSVTVKDVVAKVTRTGGLTVSGTMNCSAAVERAGGVPENTHVMVNVTWTAWQSVGRKTMVTASWAGGGHADPCYKSYSPTNPETFLPWNTSWFNSSSTPYYVFPSTGRFMKGMVHVDVQVVGGEDSPNVYTVDPATGDITSPTPVGTVPVFAVTGFDVRAR